MKALFFKKKKLSEIKDADAAFLIRKIRRENGRVKYDDSSVVLQNPLALEIAKNIFWDI